MNNFLKLIANKHKSLRLIALFIALVGSMVIYYTTGDTSAEQQSSFAVVEQIAAGNVSSGIQTTGTIEASQKLNLDVYKQAKRIEAVHVVNGGQVTKGQTLFSFDKSEAYVNAQDSRVKLVETKLALETEQENYTDVNTQIRTTEQEIQSLQLDIQQAERDIPQAKRTYLNASIEAQPDSTGNYDILEKTKPTISGYYASDKEGEYRIEIYGYSGASDESDINYAYRVSGLESMNAPIDSNRTLYLGSKGLEISFPSDIQKGDVWIVAVPNIYAAMHVENKDSYTETTTSLQKKIASYEVSLANKNQELKNLKESDDTEYRDLNIAKAEASVSQAQVALSEQYEIIREQSISAPFSGFVEGMKNVVVGATPSRDSDDPISLGTLISDEFLVTFSLGVVDIAKLSLGQKVVVTITSFPNQPPLEAVVTEISSLPNDSGVAQYEVQALINIPDNLGITLREGLLADVEVVEEEVTNVVRVPVAAISYKEGKATVQILDSLTLEQESTAQKLGIIRSINGTLPTYSVQVKVGLVGAFYAEVTSGLEVEQFVVVSASSQEGETVVQQAGFGPPNGGGRPGQ